MLLENLGLLLASSSPFCLELVLCSSKVQWTDDYHEPVLWQRWAYTWAYPHAVCRKSRVFSQAFAGYLIKVYKDPNYIPAVVWAEAILFALFWLVSKAPKKLTLFFSNHCVLSFGWESYRQAFAWQGIWWCSWPPIMYISSPSFSIQQFQGWALAISCSWIECPAWLQLRTVFLKDPLSLSLTFSSEPSKAQNVFHRCNCNSNCSLYGLRSLIVIVSATCGRGLARFPWDFWACTGILRRLSLS